MRCIYCGESTIPGLTYRDALDPRYRAVEYLCDGSPRHQFRVQEAGGECLGDDICIDPEHDHVIHAASGDP